MREQRKALVERNQAAPGVFENVSPREPSFFDPPESPEASSLGKCPPRQKGEDKARKRRAHVSIISVMGGMDPAAYHSSRP